MAWVLTLAATAPARADEGMWPLDKVPVDKIKAAYGVTLDQAWLDAAQAAAIRLSDGCSGGIVSPEGLVATNNHCVAECAQGLAGPGRDYVRDGFLTNARDEELKCAGLQAEALLSIIEVTDQVRAAAAGKTGEEFSRARDAAMALAEVAACGGEAGLRCQAISFFRGGQYKVYKYRRYADVRLVFAPEQAASAFGGDPDNFNFPRHGFDVAFLRLYVDGRPAATPRFLKWREHAPTDGEVSFIVGNPGSTDRQLTVAQLETQRDLTLPFGQLQRAELRGRLTQFSTESGERARLIAPALASIENSYKAIQGRQKALNDKDFMAAKQAAETALRARIAADPKWSVEVGDAWDRIARAQVAALDLFAPVRQLETGAGGGSDLFYLARLLVRAAQERDKANADRLPEYVDTRLPMIERRVLDTQPDEPTVEQIYLEQWLLKTRELLTVDAPQVRVMLGRESPAALAEKLAHSRVGDPAFRKALWQGGIEAIEDSNDPLVQLVRRTDHGARVARAAWEKTVSGPVDTAAEKIARARFALLGDTDYPDATFTLRLSYGKVAGWRERDGLVAPFTTFGGLYDRATGAAPFAVAPRWLKARAKLNPDTVFDFVTSNDIIGGNSGSPVLDAAGEVMGVAFDGNIHSLGGAYGYDGARNRAISVSAVAVSEALAKVYGRNALLRELTGP
ncbi:S46 family peptidase [uncultured Caulobacter sp.]|uniref:S46 family peptidase n=1 Tax=uncultured Caulobacter sp. TaxID=158749 RepID=UPI002610F9B6|nr:S46 family peptidase [uncultured Caulobacter sp.]